MNMKMNYFLDLEKMQLNQQRSVQYPIFYSVLAVFSPSEDGPKIQ